TRKKRTRKKRTRIMNKNAKLAEVIASHFHEAYERLAPKFSYTTRKSSAKPWSDVPESNKQLMIATVQDLMDRDIISDGVASHHLVNRCQMLWETYLC